MITYEYVNLPVYLWVLCLFQHIDFGDLLAADAIFPPIEAPCIY